MTFHLIVLSLVFSNSYISTTIPFIVFGIETFNVCTCLCVSFIIFHWHSGTSITLGADCKSGSVEYQLTVSTST